MIGIGLGGSILVIFLGISIINYQNIREAGAQAVIVGGVITFLGTSYTALYSEISSFYKDRASNYEKKWNLIYPIIKNIYMPWILSAKSLQRSIEKLSPPKITHEEISHVFFLVCLFYGYRLRFIMGDAGGTIILSTPKEQTTVSDAYYKISNDFHWAGDSAKTSLRVSELQHLFISKDNKEDPYVQFRFVQDVEKDESLKKSRDVLETWLKVEDNKNKVNNALKEFINGFQSEIDRVYAAWET